MKKVLCLLLIACLCGGFALAEGDAASGLSFDEGFAQARGDAQSPAEEAQAPAEEGGGAEEAQAPAEESGGADEAQAPAEESDGAEEAAPNEAGAETFELRFDEGFSLRIPRGWVSYPIEDAAIRYALGDGEGRYLYILGQSADFADFEAMRAAIDAREDCGKTSPLDLNGQPFAAFIVPGLNASGCATLLNGEALTFLFTPQDDSDYMLAVAQIMASFVKN